MAELDWEQVLERVRRGEDERTELKRWEAFSFVLTEEQIVPGTSPSDVDLAVFHDFLERQGFDPDEDLLHGEARGRVERALGWIKALGQRESYDELRRHDHPIVPPPALREGLVNAVVHRDYAILGSKVLLEVLADRIDVTSPGELRNHMQVAMALVGGHPRSRNELIANYIMVRRWMELRGRGLPIIRKNMQEFNGTEPELINNTDGQFVRLTLKR